MTSILTFSTLFPNSAQPTHGIFVETRLRHLLSAHPEIDARVVAPVPWFPFTYKGFGAYSRFAKVPRTEARSSLSVEHPNYVVIPKLGMAATPWSLYAACLPVLRKIQRERDFDLIDAHYFYPDGVAAVWLGKALNKPVVVTARGTDINLIPQYLVPRRLIQRAAREAQGIITVSQSLKDAMVALGVRQERVIVLRNGVDLNLFCERDRQEARRRLGLKGRTLLSVGLLIERKGHNFVIEALARLTDCTLLIAGEGPERPALERLSATRGVGDRVKFLGSVPHDQLAGIYSAADALVLASSREGWPNVLLEAMACGTPVVATNIWGNPEVVAEAAAGVLMRERSTLGVEEAVHKLFAALPRRSDTRAYAERFSWQATSDGQRNIFDRIVTASRENKLWRETSSAISH